MRFCSNCGEPIDDEAKYCKKCGHKHKREGNIIVYFILMILALFIFDMVSQLIIVFSGDIISTSRFGTDLILESIWALTVFVVLILVGNTYIFKRKRMPLYKSLFLAVPLWVLTFVMFAQGFDSAVSYNVTDVICALFFCLSVGLTEEFMCRGWLLTEFLERYGYDRKHVHYAIFCSALLFGGMHLTNILAGQTFFETLLQVIQTVGSGYLFGCLFYRTRNIWSCVITHGIYDFSIYLFDIAAYQSCTAGTTTPTGMLAELLTSLVLAAIYIAAGEIIIRKTKTNDLLPKPEKLTTKDVVQTKQLVKGLFAFIIICIIAYFFIAKGIDDGSTCTSYTTKDLPDNYYVTKQNLKEYDILYADYNFKVTYSNGKYILTNENTNYSVILGDDILDVVVINNSTYFVICMETYDTSGNYYLKYIQSDYSSITDDDSYLDNLLTIKKEYDVPSISTIGTISYEKGGEEYIYFESDQIKYGMIDSDGMLYELIKE